MSDLDNRVTAALSAVKESYAERRGDEYLEARARFIERCRRRRRMFTVGSVAVAGAAVAAGILFTTGRLDPFTGKAPSQDLAGDLPPGVVAAVLTGAEPVDSGVRLGHVWVANSGDSNVVHVDPRVNRVVAEVPLDGPPQEVDVGQEKIWVAGFGRVSAIDPSSEQVIGAAQVGDIDDSISVSVGEGYVWAIVDESLLLRIDPSTYDYETVIGTSAPVDVAARDGAVWVLDRDRGLMRFDPRSMQLVGEPTETFRGGSADVSAGRGVVWIASHTDDTVIRFMADGSGAPGTFQLPGTFLDMAVSESIVWVLSRRGDIPLLTALDSSSARSLGSSLVLRGDPVEVSSGGGQVWVTARRAGTILRIDPGVAAR